MTDSLYSSFSAETPPEPDYLARLNPEQKEVVRTTEGALLVLAGAGTGKTAALTARLAYLVETLKAWPSQILAVTFTNKAAREMQMRVGDLLGSQAENMPWLGTFHSIAAKMLRRHAELVGLKSDFIILDTDDQIRLLKQLIQGQGIDEKQWPAKQLAGIIDRWKNRGLTPDKIAGKEEDSFADGQGAALYLAYQKRLLSLNACDFGDLLLHMLVILTQHREVLDSYHDRFRYIMVDEYQDTNQAQYLWLRLLAQKNRNICCVGDDDQSIYSWRGAEVANILRFEEDFPGAKIIRLEHNYRSTPQILGAASGLITHNNARLGKTLWTERDQGEKVKIIGVWDGAEEARQLVADVQNLRRANIPLNKMAILIRAQFQSREFEDIFIAKNLPYRIIGGFRFYERAEIRDALAYLRVIAQPTDDLAFERIVNVPKRGIGKKAMEKLYQAAFLDRIPLAEAAEKLVSEKTLGSKITQSLGQLMNDFSEWRKSLSVVSHADVTRKMLDESGYKAMLRAVNDVQSAGRLENLTELARAMEEYDDLGSFLEHVSLVMDHENDPIDDKITLMTMHAAKGLEFDHVFLPGWEEGVFPSQRSLDEGGLNSLEEERRLAYVGITRAKKCCTIFHAANRRVYGQWIASTPSRFISELPDDHIEEKSLLRKKTPIWRDIWAEDRSKNPAYNSAKEAITPPWQLASRRGAGWQRAQKAAASPSPAVSHPLKKKDSPQYKIGDTVKHAKFGQGVVNEVDGDKVTVEFHDKDVGIRKLLSQFVSL
ncbi:UvrD/REP helicase [Zymomonas mobilis subsp. mobilis ZM4 = ATCC 31821]|uniref:DNA 3'-5' helicase n=1 Tax=Zymomonas mobilis subsp. mobilis (strain ATCC 31821 / ZM4 / CP4) TaxID=264203 RepID=Q5NQ07_ZYMMO|nr:UvrD-helicase domain-containing protein [Zymomonas mobilis]AAV89198.1 UvrD/REP helicase [Zymomonas mobilis subsp. mobilis ZM4 = ATCC 31821]AVZ25540.1 UvrD/REP helicase [Zymomonas mobilis subsp. mobilis]AVZ27431.1 UvrD/REP helicase [Zymomonas mobilis subsp. mobilis]AVZ41877.1 UvrD/REP helicase [Zymomonas mobilis subsp. mobilis ZM4 = ATCC 31821]UBQ08349.1 UvrD-helicase domain-containing protein [Zymomonas mobilis]